MSKGGAAMSDAQNRNVNPEDKRQYLGFIQDIISRMAGNSSSLKEWYAPILTLVFAIAALKQEIRIYVFLAGLLVAVAFCFMDAQYLRLERAYRRLYTKAFAGDTRLYDLNPKPFDEGFRGYIKSLFSWSVLGYYGTLIIAGAIIYRFAF